MKERKKPEQVKICQNLFAPFPLWKSSEILQSLPLYISPSPLLLKMEVLHFFSYSLENSGTAMADIVT